MLHNNLTFMYVLSFVRKINQFKGRIRNANERITRYIDSDRKMKYKREIELVREMSKEA